MRENDDSPGAVAGDGDQDVDVGMRRDEARDIGNLVDGDRHRAHPGGDEQGHHAGSLLTHE